MTNYLPPNRNEEYRTRPKTRAERQRRWLPYGMWTCADGREVIYNRMYAPIWQRYNGGPADRANHSEWVKWEEQIYFFSTNAPWGSLKANKEAKLRVDRILSDFLSGEDMSVYRTEYSARRAKRESSVLQIDLCRIEKAKDTTSIFDDLINDD